MDKATLIQELFEQTTFQTYLEIGCEKGQSFLPIKAKYKIAVDPCFQISTKRKLRSIISYPQNINNRYFEEESDEFFHKRRKYLQKIKPVDIILIDGLHTFRASLNDVKNSLNYLNGKGIIVMHDCFPPNKAASLSIKTSLEEIKNLESWTGEWCGDVWKTVIYLRKNLSELLEVCVINTDFGLGIVKIKDPNANNKFIIDEESFKEIDGLTYEELMQDKDALLDLKNAEYAKILISEISANSPKKLKIKKC